MMTQLIKEYATIDQYNQDVKEYPDNLKPKECNNCGCHHFWFNGHYERAISGRDQNKNHFDNVYIIRFKCSRCHDHYSILPSIIPLLRWYLWCMQQWVILLVLNGYSFYKAARTARVDRRTVSRWYYWLEAKYKIIYHTMCHLNKTLSKHYRMKNFYLSLFAYHHLSKVSMYLHQYNLLVPYSVS